LGVSPTIEATLDRRQSLAGADYAIAMFQVGGYRPSTVIDFEIPKKYGLRQTIADTLGIGGIMRALRTIPVLLDDDPRHGGTLPRRDLPPVRQPDGDELLGAGPGQRHQDGRSVPQRAGTRPSSWPDIGVPMRRSTTWCAGINHMAFYLKFERNGEDLYPAHAPGDRARGACRTGTACATSSSPEVRLLRHRVERASQRVRALVHQARPPDLIEQFNIPLDEYITRCEVQITGWEIYAPQASRTRACSRRDAGSRGDGGRHPAASGTDRRCSTTSRTAEQIKRSVEYGSLIIHSMETGQPRVVYGNVAQQRADRQPAAGCCVEVPVLVDKNGLQPTKIGSLPPHLAALMRTNVNVQELVVEAALTGKREYIYHAAMLDPHTAAELSLDQIWHLVDDLIEAHGDWLPTYR
jgi:alpha-galactosidase